MTLPPLFLGRLQFTMCVAFLGLFMALALALAWLLLFFKLKAHSTGRPGWTAAYRFWVRVFALTFAMTLACGVPVLLQLGTVWAGLMGRIGNVAGPLLGFAVLAVFALKSCFLGVMLFGQRRVPEIVHTLAVLMVAVGMAVAVFWVLALVSWTQTPNGATSIDGRYQIDDWVAVVFNPSMKSALAVTALGSALAVAFLIVGVTAWQALRRPLDEGERLGFRAALLLACIALLILPAAAWKAGAVIAHYQPAKAAAAAAYWHQDNPPDAVLLGWPDATSASTLGAVSISGAAGRWLGRGADGRYLALENYSGMQPPVALTFLSLRLMMVLALVMALAAWATLLKLRRRNLDPALLPRWWLRLLAVSGGAGMLFVVAGWVFTLAGSQPYAVTHAVTQAEVLGPASARALLYGTLGYFALYGVLLSAFLAMLFHAARYGVVPVRRALRGAQ